MDAAEYRRAGHAVWEAMAAGWDARHADFEHTARPVSERMLERIAPRPGKAVLELAAATGALGFAAASAVGPSGRVIVSDFSQAMVAAAGAHAAALGLANADCRVLDAERLELADAEVDGVLCRWGYMLVADPGAHGDADGAQIHARVSFYARCSVLEDLAYGLETGRTEYAAKGLDALGGLFGTGAQSDRP
jgi:Methyltransferase domain